MSKYVDTYTLMDQGGEWLGAARKWLQWNKLNGSSVTWGSNEVINTPMTVKDVEDLAAHIAAAVMNSEEKWNGRKF
jgi:hypothetical protein